MKKLFTITVKDSGVAVACRSKLINGTPIIREDTDESFLIQADSINSSARQNNAAQVDLATLLDNIESATVAYIIQSSISNVKLFFATISIVAIYNYIKNNKDLYITNNSITIDGIKYIFSSNVGIVTKDELIKANDGALTESAPKIINGFIKDRKIDLFKEEIMQAKLAAGDKELIKQYVDLFRERIKLHMFYNRKEHGQTYLNRWGLQWRHPFTITSGLTSAYRSDSLSIQNELRHAILNKPDTELIDLSIGKKISPEYIKFTKYKKKFDNLDKIIENSSDKYIIEREQLETKSNNVKRVILGSDFHCFDFSAVKGTRKYPSIYQYNIDIWPKILLNNYIFTAFGEGELEDSSSTEWLIPVNNSELSDYKKAIDIIGTHMTTNKNMFKKLSTFYIYGVQDSLLSLQGQDMKDLQKAYYEYIFGKLKENLVSPKYLNFIEAIEESQVEL